MWIRRRYNDRVGNSHFYSLLFRSIRYNWSKSLFTKRVMGENVVFKIFKVRVTRATRSLWKSDSLQMRSFHQYFPPCYAQNKRANHSCLSFKRVMRVI